MALSSSSKTPVWQTRPPSDRRWNATCIVGLALSVIATSPPATGVGVVPLPWLSWPGLRSLPRSYGARHRTVGPPASRPSR